MRARLTGRYAQLLGLLALAGCPHRDPWPLDGDGGPPDAKVVDPDPPDASRPEADARPGFVPDAGISGSCDLRMRLGDLGALDGEAISFVSSTGMDPDMIQFLAQIDNDPKPDVVSLELFKGFGPFTSGSITTGTFALTGGELNYATCGVCVRIFANYDLGTGESTQQYFQTGGTVQLTSVTGNLVGSLNDVRLEHVTIDPMTFESIPVNDGCVTGIESASFDAPITPGP